MSAPRRRTPAERQAQVEALHASIAAQVEQLRSTEQWRAFLDFARSFRTYSINNVLLLLSQRPDATDVAGFRQWQARGRQVRKGEKALRIFGYSTKTIREEDADTGEQVERRIPRFPVLSVFDISQTDAIPGAEQPASPVSLLTGADTHGIGQAVAAHLQRTGWAVTRETIASGANGYTRPDGRHVVVEARLEPAQAAKTLLHEAGHITLGHVEEDYAEYTAHRGAKETEAEAVAYVVAGLLGLDTSAYSVGYIATWSVEDPEAITRTAGRVLAAAATLAAALEEDPPA